MPLFDIYPEAILILDIEVFDKYGDGHWAQAAFLVHGHDDAMWTNDIEEALRFLKQSLEYSKTNIK